MIISNPENILTGGVLVLGAIGVVAFAAWTAYVVLFPKH